MHGEKPGPAMRIRWKPRRSWTIEGPVGDIKSQGQRGLRRTSLGSGAGDRLTALLNTVKKYGRDRVAGSSAIPAISMLSYAAGSRFVRLFGAPVLTFYDFYLDSPPASSETEEKRPMSPIRATANTSVTQVTVCWPS